MRVKIRLLCSLTLWFVNAFPPLPPYLGQFHYVRMRLPTAKRVYRIRIAAFSVADGCRSTILLLLAHSRSSSSYMQIGVPRRAVAVGGTHMKFCRARDIVASVAAAVVAVNRKDGRLGISPAAKETGKMAAAAAV